ncbi:MAG: hypothetical protein U9N33_06120 [Campylobacterota bacterium]|nr:hypothetical protein [Campylobacterota bacterium]
MNLKQKNSGFIIYIQSILVISIFLFSGCSLKDYEVTQTKVIIIKSPKLKFADLGYIRNSDKFIELELFSAGKAIQMITINHLICVSEGCLSKSSFNKDYLNFAYPDGILQDILLSHVIYGGVGKVETSDGFRQQVQDENVDIVYKVSSDTTYFKDKKNNILIKIKDAQ